MIGLIFQIKDDILGIDSNSGVSQNKGMVGEDIAQGKATILSIYALKNLEEADASKLNQYLKSKHEGTEIDLKAAVELITKSGALVFANQRIDTLRDQVLEKIDQLENSRCKVLLKQLVMYIYSRTE